MFNQETKFLGNAISPILPILLYLGAVYSIFNSILVFRYKLDKDKCINCGKCKKGVYAFLLCHMDRPGGPVLDHRRQREQREVEPPDGGPRDVALHTNIDAPVQVTAETKLPRHQAGQVSI